MADELIKHYGSWMLLVVFLGSAVDLAQAMWILKRQYRRWQRSIDARAMQRALITLSQTDKLKLKDKDENS